VLFKTGQTFIGHGIIHQWRDAPPARHGWSIEQVRNIPLHQNNNNIKINFFL